MEHSHTARYIRHSVGRTENPAPQRTRIDLAVLVSTGGMLRMLAEVLGTDAVTLGAGILDAAIGDAVAALPEVPAVDLLPPHLVGHDPGDPGYAQLIYGDGRWTFPRSMTLRDLMCERLLVMDADDYPDEDGDEQVAPA